MRIFLAHASEDKALVRDLYLKLKSRGFNPWLDEIDLLPGQNWRNEIPRAIQENDIFIACLSRHSVQKQGYIQRELRLALDICAEKPPDTIYIIPLRFEDCEIPNFQIPSLGLSLRDYQWLDYWQQPDGFERLIKSIDIKIKANNPQNLTLTLPNESIEKTSLSQEYFNLPVVDSTLQKTIISFTEGFSYNSPIQLRRSLEFLTKIALESNSTDVREVVVFHLKKFFCNRNLYRKPVANEIREVRCKIMNCIIKIAPRVLASYFQNGELEDLDLYGVDFSNTNLHGVSFCYSFVVGVNFSNAFLEGVNFSCCCLRNTDFTDAVLTNVTFDEADWFNASGLTDKQLESAKQETLIQCPKNRRTLHIYLKKRYSFPFKSWDKALQTQLTNSWDEYLKEGGLYDLTSSWKKS